MKKWRFTATATISLNTVVEAESEEEARQIASERGVVSLCHQCAGGEVSEEWCTSGELDGEPENIRRE